MKWFNRSLGCNSYCCHVLQARRCLQCPPVCPAEPAAPPAAPPPPTGTPAATSTATWAPSRAMTASSERSVSHPLSRSRKINGGGVEVEAASLGFMCEWSSGTRYMTFTVVTDFKKRLRVHTNPLQGDDWKAGDHGFNTCAWRGITDDTICPTNQLRILNTVYCSVLGSISFN